MNQHPSPTPLHAGMAATGKDKGMKSFSGSGRLGLGAMAMIAATGTFAAAVCKVQVNATCASNYTNPADGCPDQITNLEQSHNLIVPSSETPVAGWTSQQPESCLASIQFMVKENPDDPNSPCIASGSPFQQLLSGLIGAGESCTAGGGGGDD